MNDILPEDVLAPGREAELVFHDGSKRRVVATEIETPFPSGELIVSQTDTAGVIIQCNPAFVRMSGYTVEELVGSPQHILRHPDMPRAVFKDLWDTIDQGRKWHGYVKNLRKDGGYYWVYATIVPNIRDGHIHGYTSVRREPSRKKIAEMAALYRDLLAAEQAGND